MTSIKKIKVLVVDDSAVIRQILKAGLSQHPDIEVVGIANDPYDARDKITKLTPDVITLDLEMPRMSGLEFISILMKYWPIPVVVFSALVDGKCDTSLKALELGAVEILPKPKSDVSHSAPKLISQLSDLIIAASHAKVHNKVETEVTPLLTTLSKTTDKIIAIGASTGGTEAIRSVLQPMPSSVPGIAIIQHMPEIFTKSFADRLNKICPEIEVREAVNGDYINQGVALIAPGNMHMAIKKSGARYYVDIRQGPRVCRHRPSVDVLFNSVAEKVGKNAVGAILTGMGDDGSNGLLAMKNSGAKTVAQDEESCVVYGMPGEAVRKGAVDKIVPISKMAETLLNLL